MTDSSYNADAVMSAFERKDYASVLRDALPHANAGNAAAQCMISLLYQCGFGVPLDLAKAEEWLLKATVQNDALAWNNLGTLYIVAGGALPHGEGKSRECYLRAKELGFDCAEPYPPP
jgi:TPR repeat protein